MGTFGWIVNGKTVTSKQPRLALPKGTSLDQGRLSALGRSFALTVCLIPVCFLVLAGTLTPSPQGSGTHRQLGLPPCSIRLAFGVRCPSCGMTTSWSHFARGNWIESVRANAGGFSLAWVAIGMLGFGLRTAWTGVWPVQTWKILGIAAAVVSCVTAFDWLARWLSG